MKMNEPATPEPLSPAAELAALSDADLAAIAHSELSPGDATRLQWLLEENADNALTTSERAELVARAGAAEQFARRKEHAAQLLAARRSPAAAHSPSMSTSTLIPQRSPGGCSDRSMSTV